MKLKVPMATVFAQAVEFNMIYNAKTYKFERVEILHGESKEILGMASFTTV